MATLEKLFEESYRPTDQRKVVGHYQLGPILGQGRSSVVRHAVHCRDGTVAAIKVLPRTAGCQGKKRELQFRQETETLLRVRHAHIVKLMEVFETSRHLYVVMEMVGGCTLRSLLKSRRRVGEEEARTMIEQLCAALSHLHISGIVHRDVKPDNIMVSEADLQVKLIDLGLSGKTSSGSRGDQCGSPVYMAPELLRAQQHGCPVDMWSLGVTLYECLAGHVPFEPERGSRQAIKNMAAVYSLIVRRACGDICDGIPVSPNGADFLRRLLQMEETSRMTSQESLKHPWLSR